LVLKFWLAFAPEPAAVGESCTVVMMRSFSGSGSG
jgi:hypothetical protein